MTSRMRAVVPGRPCRVDRLETHGTLTLGVFWWNTPLALTCAGFLVLMSVKAFIFGNAGALAAGSVTHVAGSAAAVQGVATASAWALAAPLASAGGGVTAVPMVIVMLVGITGSLASFVIGTHGPEAVRPQP